jgi:hypothetical protein
MRGAAARLAGQLHNRVRIGPAAHFTSGGRRKTLQAIDFARYLHA